LARVRNEAATRDALERDRLISETGESTSGDEPLSG
jgi:hypothetical protein